MESGYIFLAIFHLVAIGFVVAMLFSFGYCIGLLRDNYDEVLKPYEFKHESKPLWVTKPVTVYKDEPIINDSHLEEDTA